MKFFHLMNKNSCTAKRYQRYKITNLDSGRTYKRRDEGKEDSIHRIHEENANFCVLMSRQNSKQKQGSLHNASIVALQDLPITVASKCFKCQFLATLYERG